MYHYYDFIDTQYNNISYGLFVYDDYYRRATLIYNSEAVNNSTKAPLQIGMSIENGDKQFHELKMDKFIRSLVVPPERQGIDEILRSAGMKSYSAVEIYVKIKGNVVKDTCRLVEIEKPDWVQEDKIFDSSVEYDEPIDFDAIQLD